jgi:hypothetical protein
MVLMIDYWNKKRRERPRVNFGPKHYYLRRRILQRRYWSMRCNVKYYQDHILPIIKDNDVIGRKRKGWRYRYLCRRILKTENEANETRKIPRTFEAEPWRKRLEIDRAVLTELVRRADPIKQFVMLRLASNPANFTTKHEKKKMMSIRRALIAAVNLTGECCPRNDDNCVCCQDNKGFTKTRTVYHSQNQHELPIVIDTGASVSVTPIVADFVGPIRPYAVEGLKGLNSEAKVVGEGTVEWMIRDVLGSVRRVRTTEFYVPEASIRLFSPHTYFREHEAGSLFMDSKKIEIELDSCDKLEFPFQLSSNLPLMLTTRHFRKSKNVVGLPFQDETTLSDLNGMTTFLTVADERNQNLTASQRELLLWHQKLAHTDMQRIQALLRDPQDKEQQQVLFPKERASTSCPRPLCAACQLSKQGRRGAGTHRELPKENEQALKREHVQPGDMVSVDQYMSGLSQNQRKRIEEPTVHRRYHFRGSCDFNDLYLSSNFVTDW